jgi:hypothetical protein
MYLSNTSKPAHPPHIFVHFYSKFVCATVSHYRTPLLCRVPGALGKEPNPHGKLFAECHTRHRTLDKFLNGKEPFAECFSRALGEEFAVC